MIVKSVCCLTIFRWVNRRKSCLRALIAAIAPLHLMVNIAATAGFLYISRHNYPGGQAMAALHQIEPLTAGKTWFSAAVLRTQIPVLEDAALFQKWVHGRLGMGVCPFVSES